MQPRRLALPLGFGLLGACCALPASVVFRYPVTLGVALAFCAGALSGPLVWASTVGSAPTRIRGALVGALATLTGAVLVGPVVSVPAVVASGTRTSATVVLQAVTLVTVLTVLAGLATTPLAAALGAVLAGRPSSTVGTPVRLSRLSPPTTTARQLGVVVSVVTLACVGAGVVQYTDPTTPTVGDAPAYAGADAPAAEQVAQAQARTRSVSYTATVQSVAYAPNGSRVGDAQGFRFEHDRARDLVRVVMTGEFGTSSTLVTEDTIWYWNGDSTAPDPGAMRPNDRPPRSDHHHGVTAVTDGPARVVDRTTDHVVIRYPTPATRDGDSYDLAGNRTVTVDRTTGRLASIETVRVHDDGRRVVRTTSFEDYGETTVARPETPTRPLHLHVFDLLDGPLNGRTPLHS